jgi:hypothetical protein
MFKFRLIPNLFLTISLLPMFSGLSEGHDGGKNLGSGVLGRVLGLSSLCLQRHFEPYFVALNYKFLKVETLAFCGAFLGSFAGLKIVSRAMFHGYLNTGRKDAERSGGAWWVLGGALGGCTPSGVRGAGLYQWGRLGT